MFELWSVYREKCCEHFGLNWAAAEDHWLCCPAFLLSLAFMLYRTCSIGWGGGWNQKPKLLKGGSGLLSSSPGNLDRGTLSVGQVSPGQEAEGNKPVALGQWYNINRWQRKTWTTQLLFGFRLLCSNWFLWFLPCLLQFISHRATRVIF